MASTIFNHQFNHQIKSQGLTNQSDGDKFMEGRNHFNVKEHKKSVFKDTENTWDNRPKKLADGVEKDSYFDTNFKFQDFDEKQLVNRFLKWKRNTYIAYTAVNENMQFANDKGEHFQFSNTILHQRFDELFPWSFIIADREFFLHNSLPKEYWNGRRYLYMVDQAIYDSVCKGEHKPRSIEHKSFPGVRIFRGYDSLIELIEEKCNAQPILIIGKEPWARLRYFIDQIRLTYAEHFETCSEATDDKYKFPLDRFQSFLNFNSVVKIEQSFKSHAKDDTQNEDVPVELPEQFSDFIKFSYKASTIKRVEMKRQQELASEQHFQFITIVKPKNKR